MDEAIIEDTYSSSREPSIREELLDMIEDVKENLTSQQYRDIAEKIADIGDIPVNPQNGTFRPHGAENLFTIREQDLTLLSVVTLENSVSAKWQGGTIFGVKKYVELCLVRSIIDFLGFEMECASDGYSLINNEITNIKYLIVTTYPYQRFKHISKDDAYIRPVDVDSLISDDPTSVKLLDELRILIESDEHYNYSIRRRRIPVVLYEHDLRAIVSSTMQTLRDENRMTELPQNWINGTTFITEDGDDMMMIEQILYKLSYYRRREHYEWIDDTGIQHVGTKIYTDYPWDRYITDFKIPRKSTSDQINDLFDRAQTELIPSVHQKLKERLEQIKANGYCANDCKDQRNNGLSQMPLHVTLGELHLFTAAAQVYPNPPDNDDDGSDSEVTELGYSRGTTWEYNNVTEYLAIKFIMNKKNCLIRGTEHQGYLTTNYPFSDWESL